MGSVDCAVTVEFFMRYPDIYSVLVLDNRGWGNSETTSGRYTTQLQAQDLLLLLSSPEVGWLPPVPITDTNPVTFTVPTTASTPKIHFVGVSMGGMILLELLRLTINSQGQSTVAASATLVSTTSGHAIRAADVEASLLVNQATDPSSPEHTEHTQHTQKRFATGLPPLPGVQAISTTITRSILGQDTPEARTARMDRILFPPAWLDTVPAPTLLRANAYLRQQGVPETQIWHHPNRQGDHQTSNEDFWLSASLWRAAVFARLQPAPDQRSALAAISAALTHQVKTSVLQTIDRALSSQGTSRVTIVSGTIDNLVNIHNSSHMAAVMPHSTPVWIEGGGHALLVQNVDELNQAIWETIQRSQVAAGLPDLPPFKSDP